MKTKQNNRLILALISASLSMTAFTSHAGTTTTNTFERGWYVDTGTHDPTNDSYFAGTDFGSSLHDFFAFNIVSPVPGQTYSAATLNLYNPGSTAAISDVFELWDYTGGIASLIAGSGGIAAYNDLGTGISFGTTMFSTADDATTLSIVLNSEAVSAINAASGGQFVIGGSVLSGANFLFGNSKTNNPADGRTSLTLTTSAVPEPSSLVMLMCGVTGFSVLRRRKLN